MAVTVADVADLFGVSSSTVQTWSRRFASYLSESATPPRGQVKQYTPGDLEVFALVATLTPTGATYKEIGERLEAGERGTPPTDDPDSRHSLATDRELELAVQLATWQARYNDMAERVGELEAERLALSDARGRNEELREQLARMEAQLEKVRGEKEAALERAIRAETERTMAQHSTAYRAMEQPAADASTPQPERRSWWRRLLRK